MNRRAPKFSKLDSLCPAPLVCSHPKYEIYPSKSSTESTESTESISPDPAQANPVHPVHPVPSIPSVNPEQSDLIQPNPASTPCQNSLLPSYHPLPGGPRVNRKSQIVIQITTPIRVNPAKSGQKVFEHQPCHTNDYTSQTKSNQIKPKRTESQWRGRAASKWNGGGAWKSVSMISTNITLLTELKPQKCEFARLPYFCYN